MGVQSIILVILVCSFVFCFVFEMDPFFCDVSTVALTFHLDFWRVETICLTCPTRSKFSSDPS